MGATPFVVGLTDSDSQNSSRPIGYTKKKEVTSTYLFCSIYGTVNKYCYLWLTVIAH